MAILPILTAPDPLLKQKAKPVETVDDDVRKLMDDMLETMYDAPGIGLAAPQVGALQRVIVIDCSRDGDEAEPWMMANPEIIARSDEQALFEEGCLSVPDQYAEVKRPVKVTVRFLDQHNEMREIEAEGLLATVIQHEIDHLEGTLFVDHLSRLKRGLLMKKLQKAKKAAV